MAYIENECDCETCSRGNALPERFGGWYCTCECHTIKRINSRELKALENVKDYCKSQKHCDDCLIYDQCEVLNSSVDSYILPELWNITDMIKIIKKIKGE